MAGSFLNRLACFSGSFEGHLVAMAFCSWALELFLEGDKFLFSVLSVNTNAMEDTSMTTIEWGKESNFIPPLKMYSHPAYIKI